MTNAKRDNNNIPVLLGVSNADGTTVLPAYVNASNHAILVEDNTTGSDLTGDNALRDANVVCVGLAVSSSDGVTPVPIYIKSSTNALLVKST